MSSQKVDIKQLEAKIKEDPKNSNDLVKISSCLESSDRAIVQGALQSLRRLFFFFAENRSLKVPSEAVGGEPLAKYNQWLWGHYVAFLSSVIDLISDDDENTQVTALRTAMEIVSRQNVLKGDRDAYGFGNETYNRVVRQLLLAVELKGELLSVFKGEYLLAYMDVQYYTMKNMSRLLDSTKAPTPSFIKNSLTVLNSFIVPEDKPDVSNFLVKPHEDIQATISGDENDSEESDEDSDDDVNDNNKRTMANKESVERPSKKIRKLSSLFDVREHKRAFTSCWIAFLKHSLPEDSYKTVLAKLPNDVMPHLTDPLLLADFLTDSYNIGGITSLLALNSLFILIQQYNFDYPDFFVKLYNLLSDETLFRSKYRKRLFKLLALFFSSTYLPAYLVAAFAKRLSRLALTAEPGAILFIIPCVYNLVLRHKECLQLIHRTASQSVADKAAEKRELLNMKNPIDTAAAQIAKNSRHIELKGGLDPFDNDEQDPAQCNALKSSLWEVFSMKQHYHAGVAAKAKMFEEKIRSQMLDLTPELEISYSTLFDQASKRRENQEVPLAFEASSSVFDASDVFSKVFAF
ncbi:unnamed protein product [Aphanomyces euteiches]|uniref:CCAAT-binding factor domain-containing protein n=1 Tax=Aphanomyces euteiches TaxID=100861 RepID=A0A6G0X520_9STRA|nr:hypothetical protein Ae201684_008494 [Aphanomyces euteiches]KAH9070052.1 hypothetical protein Ae201684P_002424 [Aphanomyces euteiches]KAH9140206.1 hypothetical protein AeRB84_015498 [Aphanomyces euteiches]